MTYRLTPEEAAALASIRAQIVQAQQALAKAQALADVAQKEIARLSAWHTTSLEWLAAIHVIPAATFDAATGTIASTEPGLTIHQITDDMLLRRMGIEGLN